MPGRKKDRQTDTLGTQGGGGHSRCRCSGEFRETGAPGAEQVGAWPWLVSLSWPPLGARPLETALGRRHSRATPRDAGLPHTCLPVSAAEPRPGPRASRGPLHQKLQKTAQGPSDCRPPPVCGTWRLSRSQTQRPIGATPHRGETRRLSPPWSCAGDPALSRPPTIPPTGRDQDGARAP